MPTLAVNRSTSAVGGTMRHDDTTYIDDEGMGFVVLGDDGENEGVLPVTVTAGGRQWSYGEEAWGGWDPE
jgi:hypothetical protein